MERVTELKIEDLKKGDIVTVLNGLILLNGMEDNSCKGDVLKIKSICYPYVVFVERGDDYRFSLDLRKYTLGKLSKEYIRAIKSRRRKRTKNTNRITKWFKKLIRSK